MTPTENEDELMERMQRVATKPRKAATRARKTSRTAARSAARTATRRATAVATAAATDAVSRLGSSSWEQRMTTLVEWGRWELTSVPVQRWNMFKTLVRGR